MESEWRMMGGRFFNGPILKAHVTSAALQWLALEGLHLTARRLGIVGVGMCPGGGGGSGFSEHLAIKYV